MLFGSRRDDSYSRRYFLSGKNFYTCTVKTKNIILKYGTEQEMGDRSFSGTKY